MRKSARLLLVAGLGLCISCTVLRATQVPPKTPEAVPFAASGDAIERIKAEGLNHSQVMPLLSYLTDVIGPRLTGSPNLKRANLWTRDKLASWGLSDTRLEAWGPFGRGWTLKRFSAQIISPQSIPLVACPLAWSPGFKQSKVGSVIYVDAQNEADLDKFRGKLKGAFVLLSPPIELQPHFEPQATRISDKQIQEWDTMAVESEGESNSASSPAPKRLLDPKRAALDQFWVKRSQFLLEEGAAAILYPSFPGDGGTLRVTQALVPQTYDTPLDKVIRARDVHAPRITPQVVVTTEQYNRLFRMIAAGEKLRLAMEFSVQFHDTDLMAYNTLGEIPGTDKRKEVVMLGAHLDSFHAGTGAADDGAGVAACMEAMRILQALNLHPRRTIRIGLWSGEEQGALGSQAYVKRHLGQYAPPAPTQTKTLSKTVASVQNTTPEYDRFAAYFHLDIGGGKIRGLFADGNIAARSVLRGWLPPLQDLGVSVVTLAGAHGSDHDNFSAIGLPAFMFMQDDLDYFTRAMHFNQDVYDRVPSDDLKQVATVMAIFVYNAAMWDEKIPRKQTDEAGR
jgi:carboxypeptidase Q